MKNLTLHIMDMIREFLTENNMTSILLNRKEIEKFADAIIDEVRQHDKEAWEESK